MATLESATDLPHTCKPYTSDSLLIIDYWTQERGKGGGGGGGGEPQGDLPCADQVPAVALQ